MGQALRGHPGTRRRGRHAVAERLSGEPACAAMRGGVTSIITSTRNSIRKCIRRAAMALMALMLVAGVLPAQPKGIQLDSGRFTVLADTRDERLARALLQSALQRDTFPGLPRPRDSVEIVIARDANEF